MPNSKNNYVKIIYNKDIINSNYYSNIVKMVDKKNIIKFIHGIN